MSSKNKYKTNFLDEWRERVEFKDWLEKVSNDSSVALCCYWHKNFPIGGQGMNHFFFSHEKSET